MNADIKLGRIWGIPIGLNYSWFLIFALVTFSLATALLPAQFGGLSTPAYWLMAAITSLLFFASVLAHELGHAFIALRNSIPVRAITLFLLGGVAQITREPQSPGVEFRVAIAGPLVSLAAALSFGLIYLVGQEAAFIAAPALWLARINLILALFNLIPGFPLDGGRVLRALVWQATGQAYRSTRIAAAAGQVVAFSFIGFGLLGVLSGGLFNGIWLIFIGWYLRNAAAASAQYAGIQETLRGVRVGEIMSRRLIQVPAHTPVESLTGPHYLNQGERAFFVGEDSRIQGMLTLTDIARMPRSHWALTPVQNIMVPDYLLTTVDADTDLATALDMMENANIKQAPVVENGEVRGLLSRERILRLLQGDEAFTLLRRAA
ncbi:MAG: site-2 protease family protein [Caldilineales bacterium]|nr:site-2 protease family protein [Caldilineales bacterium]